MRKGGLSEAAFSSTEPGSGSERDKETVKDESLLSRSLPLAVL
jgi:hypothetical protein